MKVTLFIRDELSLAVDYFIVLLFGLLRLSFTSGHFGLPYSGKKFDVIVLYPASNYQ